MTKRMLTLALLALTGTAAACGSEDDAIRLPQASESVELDPADFTTRVDNPYWPMKPGSRWVYREGDERVVVTVTDKTKKVANGVVARVVHDRVTSNGRLVEDTYDWYAQDRDGNVWYLGEAVKNYKNGKFSDTHGSWEAGADGAQAGILVPGQPRVGTAYRQEYLEGEAEDQARVLSLDEKVQVPFGFFSGALMTKDYTPLEPRVVEHKFYVRNVGPVLSLHVSGGSERSELLRFEH